MQEVVIWTRRACCSMSFALPRYSRKPPGVPSTTSRGITVPPIRPLFALPTQPILHPHSSQHGHSLTQYPPKSRACRRCQAHGTGICATSALNSTAPNRHLLLADRISQLSLYSDLKALYLVSKDWNSIATEYQYRKTVLHNSTYARDDRLSNWLFPGTATVFRRCLDISARKHLIHTRSLNLLEGIRHEPGSGSANNLASGNYAVSVRV